MKVKGKLPITDCLILYPCKTKITKFRRCIKGCLIEPYSVGIHWSGQNNRTRRYWCKFHVEKFGAFAWVRIVNNK